MGTERLDLDKYGKERPKFTQDDIEEGDVAIVTAASFEELVFDGRPSAIMTFEESGDKALWLSKTDLKSLVERLGDVPSKWSGKRVVVEKVKREYKGQTYNKVGIAPADEWDTYLNPRPQSVKKGRR